MNNDYKCHFSGAPINATPISCRYRVYFSCWLDYRKMIKHFGGNRSGKDNDTRMPNVFTGRELTQSVGAAAASTNKNLFHLLLPRTKPHLIFNFSFFLQKIFLGCLFFITPFYALSHLIISFFVYFHSPFIQQDTYPECLRGQILYPHYFYYLSYVFTFFSLNFYHLQFVTRCRCLFYKTEKLSSLICSQPQVCDIPPSNARGVQMLRG
jgi:hypothetical protein